MKTKHYLLSAFAIMQILLACLMASCSDTHEDNPPAPDGGEVPEGYMAVEIVVPGATEAPTRALNPPLTLEHENDVQTIDVLAFNDADNKFLFHEEGTDIKTTAGGTNGSKKVFYVKVPQDGTYTQIYFMVIANAHAQVEAAKTAGHIATTKTSDDVMNSLTFDISGKWPAQKPGGFTRFPMWGLSGAINLTQDPITVAPIDLLRAVAKIDVGVNFDPLGVAQGLTPATLFKLKEVYVYNALNKLQVAPMPGIYDDVTKKVTTTSIPTGATALPFIKYDGFTTYDSDEFSFTSGIFVAEHAAGTIAKPGRENNFFLVIGASYDGGATTYYRVDFMKTTRDGSGEVTHQEFLPILRNHRYRVNIVKAHGKGFNTPAEAAAAMGANTNLTVDIIADDTEYTEYVYDGQYALGVSKGNFTLDKKQHSNIELGVHSTNDVQPWTVTSNASWLTLITPSNPTGKSKLKFSAAAHTGATARMGKITITCGRLSIEVTVTQEPVAGIEVSDKSNYYTMNSSLSHSFILKSAYDWHVKVKSDPKDIIRTFDTSGLANISGSPFSFKLENDVHSLHVIEANAILTFYSLKGEFPDYDVAIKGRSALEFPSLPNLYVYPVDQPARKYWATYISQCANLPALSGQSWRLPSDAEIEKIIRDSWEGVSANQGNVEKYGFTWNMYYWSANIVHISGIQHMYLRNTSNAAQAAHGPGDDRFTARCVRTK